MKSCSKPKCSEHVLFGFIMHTQNACEYEAKVCICICVLEMMPLPLV